MSLSFKTVGDSIFLPVPSRSSALRTSRLIQIVAAFTACEWNFLPAMGLLVETLNATSLQVF